MRAEAMVRVVVSAGTAVLTAAGLVVAVPGAARADQVGTVAVNGAQQSVNVSPAGSRSLFSFTGVAGQRITAQVTAATWPGRAAGSTLSLVNAAGTTLASAALKPNATLTAVKLPAAGTFRVVIDLAGSDTGTGKLGVVDTAGGWSGTVTQAGLAPFPMSLNIDLVANQLKGTAEFPSIPCGGTETQTSRTATKFVLHQVITHGPGSCLATSDLTVTRVDAATLRVAFVSGAATASATLKAIPKSRVLATGDYTVTYGALGTVTISGSPAAGFRMVGKSPIVVTGGSCTLPAGTPLASWAKPVNNIYTGTHNLYFVTTCASAGSTSLNLAVYGNVLYGFIGNGETHTYTKV